MNSAFINVINTTPLQSALPSMFAKSSLVTSSIFYIFSNKRILDKITNYKKDQNEQKDISSPSRSNNFFYTNLFDRYKTNFIL